MCGSVKDVVGEDSVDSAMCMHALQWVLHGLVSLLCLNMVCMHMGAVLITDDVWYVRHVVKPQNGGMVISNYGTML